jgi:N-acyl-D-amino-acid deacylase
MVLIEARRRGFTISEDNLQPYLKRTATHLERGREKYLGGRGQGGGHITAGYALWTLQAGGWSADKTTSAVSQYLIGTEDARNWTSSSKRPPSEVSHFTATYVAVRGLDAFGTKEQASRIAARKAKALDWLRHTSPKDTEDRVFRLLALDRLEASKEATQTAAKQLVAKQRADGGWAQTADLESDAYATGSALFSLHQTDELSVDDPVYRRGLQFLLRDQQEDGSWRVKSRSKPFQKHFESGYPHGKDQFISITAASWATLAMLFALPERERVKDESP